MLVIVIVYSQNCSVLYCEHYPHTFQQFLKVKLHPLVSVLANVSVCVFITRARLFVIL